jgi:protein-L-isoaspartate(D-aspartate) O-methyltransferase
MPRAVFFEFVSVLSAIGCSLPATARLDDPDASLLRKRMVEEQIERRGVRDPRVLAALEKVPRHKFVRGALVSEAYADHALPIGGGQTISQPYIVAVMTAALQLHGGERVLEVGTGSGYQAAVLAELGAEVYSIEILPELAKEAAERLAGLGYGRVRVRAGDGYRGWPEASPFDGILVTASAPRIPEPLKEQLKDGGRLVIPVGDLFQELRVLTRHGTTFTEEQLFPVRFVPMTGEVNR